MSVAFTSGTGSETVRASYQRVVTQSLDLMRPAGEHRSVTMAETESTVRLDFARNTDAPRSITVAVDGDDDCHTRVFRSVCGFLWMYWAKDIAQRS